VKKLPLLLTLAIVAVIAGGYFIYDQFIKKPSLAAWDLIPDETILVYETSNCSICIDQVKSSPVLEIITRAMEAGKQADSLSVLRDLMVANAQPGTLFSLHITTKDDFDFTFYLPQTKLLEHQLGMVVDGLKKSAKAVQSEHEYNGVDIKELTIGNKSFSWIVLDKFIVASFSPVLIEDVVRTYKSGEPGFKQEMSGIYRLPRVKEDGGNIYLHLKNFTEWFSLFTTEEPSALISRFGQSALLDVKVSDDNKLVLNGYSLDSVNQENYVLSAFSGQNPVPFTLKQYVSNRSVMFASYGISDGDVFHKDRLKLAAKVKDRDSLEQIARDAGVDLDKLYANLTGEVGVAWVESRAESTSKILIITASKGIESWVSTLNTLTEKRSIDTVFFEKYSSYEIRELPVYRFPEKFFNPLVSGFDRSYYTSLGNTLIIGEDLDELKRYLEDIDHEETWGKSVAQNKFLEATLLESNVSLYINTPRVWNVLEKKLQPKWKTFLDENRSLLNALDMGAIQFSHLNDSYYTNVSWAYKPIKLKGNKASAAAPAASEKLVTNFGQGIATFYVVKNHVDKSNEVLVQDSSKAVSLVSKDGKALWTLPLEDFISGDVHQVDYFNNGKLQYFFATPRALHIVDRLGNYVKPFPVRIEEDNIEFVSLVDYDHSRKYRFLIAGKSGKLWMFDKEGVNLEGWRPRIVDESLSAPPEHYRIRGKDYIIAIRKDGFVFAFNRRGELLKHFPLDLNARPAGDFYLENGKSLEDTYFVVVSRDGTRIKFNMQGKIQTRETLVKNTADAQFSLVRENDSRSYLIVRQEAKLFSVFDENLNEIIKSDFIGNNAVNIRYLNFGGGKSYIAITDRTQDLSFVYDAKGKLLTLIPIDSHAITVGDAEPANVYFSLGKSLTIRGL
jgi:hypothetical protein